MVSEMTARKSCIALFLVAAALTVLAAPAAAKNCPYTPARGSAERARIMDSLREPVMQELKQSVIFVVSRLSVCGNWAFVEAEPQQPGGRPVDWTVGTYADAVADDMCGGYAHALLVKKGGTWRVREHAICATDVPYVTWAEEFGAPAALFPKFD
jgi:hypothetical protein